MHRLGNDDLARLEAGDLRREPGRRGLGELECAGRDVEGGNSVGPVAVRGPHSRNGDQRVAREGSRSASSVIVPGVTSRVTSRRTTDFEPRFRASAGSSSCSQTATRWPCAMSRCRYSSARCTGTPHIGMSTPLCRPRLVSTMPSARLGDLGILEEQLVEIAHPIEEKAIGIGGLDLDELRHDG